MGLITKENVKYYVTKKGNQYLTYRFKNKNNEWDIMYIGIPDNLKVCEK